MDDLDAELLTPLNGSNSSYIKGLMFTSIGHSSWSFQQSFQIRSQGVYRLNLGGSARDICEFDPNRNIQTGISYQFAILSLDIDLSSIYFRITDLKLKI